MLQLQSQKKKFLLLTAVNAGVLTVCNMRKGHTAFIYIYYILKNRFLLFWFLGLLIFAKVREKEKFEILG